MKCDTYKEDLPGYSLSYLVNGDASGIDDDDIKNIDEFMEYYYNLADELNGHVVIDVISDEGSFTSDPAFGLACDCYESNINILHNTYNILNFHDLPEKWQEEAKSNLDEYAEETMYLEPDDDSDPAEHILWDLSECMRQNGNHEGFEYNAVICISNNSAMLLNVSDSGEEATIKFV